MMLLERNGSRYALESARQIISMLKPGEQLRMTARVLKDIEPMWHKGAQFGPADRILGGIIGSGYSLWHEEDGLTRDVTFGRIAPLTDGRRTYVDPDQRHHFVRDGAFWRLKPVAPADGGDGL